MGAARMGSPVWRATLRRIGALSGGQALRRVNRPVASLPKSSPQRAPSAGAPAAWLTAPRSRAFEIQRFYAAITARERAVAAYGWLPSRELATKRAGGGRRAQVVDLAGVPEIGGFPERLV